MSFNGSGTFLINSLGQPVVSGTTISSTAFNTLTADLGTGLSTCLLKDGTQTATAKIPFILGIKTLTVDEYTVTNGVPIQGSTQNPAVDAAAGYVGEYFETIVNLAGAIALTTATTVDVASILNLGAGDWDLYGNVSFTGGATTLVKELDAGIGTTTLTLPTTGTIGRAQNSYGTAGLAVFAQNNVSLNFGGVRLSLATATTVRLTAQAIFTTSTCSAYGHIVARRRR